MASDFSEEDLKLLTGRAKQIAQMAGWSRDPKVTAMLKAEIDRAKGKKPEPNDR